MSKQEKQRLDGILNIALAENGGAFDLPCCAFKGGLCSIYSERPAACSKYRCKLLKNVEAGRLSRPAAEEIVKEVKAMRAGIDRAVGHEVPALAGLSLGRQMAALERHFDGKMPVVEFRKSFARLLLDYFVLTKRLHDHFHQPKKSGSGS